MHHIFVVLGEQGIHGVVRSLAEATLKWLECETMPCDERNFY